MKNPLRHLLPRRPIDPVIHQIGYDTVAEALATSDTLEAGTPEAAPEGTTWTEVQPSTNPERIKGVVTAAQPGTPEYHLDLTEKMIASLTTRIERAEDQRASQQSAYVADREERAAKQEQSDREQTAEIAGLSKSLAAYTAARDVLAVPVPPGPPVQVAGFSDRLKIGSLVDLEGQQHEIVGKTRVGARRVTLDGRAHYVLPRNVQPPTE